MCFPNGSAVKNPSVTQETQEKKVRSLVGKIPWKKAWQPTPLFLPGESQRHWSPVSKSPWGSLEHKNLWRKQFNTEAHKNIFLKQI